MAIPFWGFDPPNDVADDFSANATAWDVVYLGGIRAPGIASVRTRRAHRIDHRISPGDSAMQISNLGPERVDVEITLTLWTAAQWQAWQDLAPRIFKNPGKLGTLEPQEAIEVWHPSLQVYRITSLYCFELGVPEPASQPGVRKVQLRFVEFRPMRGGGMNGPTRAEVDLPSQTNHTNDYSGTSSPTLAPSTTQTGP